MEFTTFGLGDTPQDSSAAELGGKGAGLVWLVNHGMSVPPGFIIPVSVWSEYRQKPKGTMKAIAKVLPLYLKHLELHFGYQPLLSVRSGSRVSCPGMMDTILNVGIDGQNEDFWIHKLGSACYHDSLYRLVTMFGSVVKGLRRESFGSDDTAALAAYESKTGDSFPSATDQLLGAIEAVFKSWDNDRAKHYRLINNIPYDFGTAVTIQAMVFGNLNEQSGTGVLFTRNPNTGAMLVTGEFLVNAQGEDVVAGIRTPVNLDKMADWNPTVHDQLLAQVLKLESLKKDVQDVEFTVQDGVLYLLQTRTAKRSAAAAVKIALDMVKQYVLSKVEAVQRVTVKEFDLAQVAHLDPSFKEVPTFTGIAASNGVVSGKPVFSKEDAISCKEPCILITPETTPDDIAGMSAAVGVITMVGGFTSHAAVVSRQMNRACIVGVGQPVDAFQHLDIISMDGATGQIWTGDIPIIKGETNGLISEFSQLVWEVAGVVPVLTQAPTKPMPEALLYVGDQVLDTAKAFKLVLDTAFMVTKLYVDLTMAPGVETDYLKLVSTHKHQQKLVDALQAITYTDLKGKLILIVADASTTFQTVTAVGTLEDLVLAGHDVVVDGAFQLHPAVKKVLGWKQKEEGLSFLSFGVKQAGAKSFLSIEQALQSVAKGVESGS